MNEGWQTSLLWLKDSNNSPDPFGDFDDPDFYYRLYETPFQYPESAYGVMSWWDYGYWISILGGKDTLADNGTLNGTQIAWIGRMFMSTEDNAITMR
jgi:dolichyl-diphosphooligosaccharide--protein glycosyltransferase